MSISSDFQGKLKDYIKLASKTDGANGEELIKLKNELNTLACQLSPQDCAMLQEQACKQACSEMGNENKKFQSKNGQPKYQIPMFTAC